MQESEYVQREQEFGYFVFGASFFGFFSFTSWRGSFFLTLALLWLLGVLGGLTIVILFEKGKVEWDEDILINGRASLETLVRVGMGIGRGRPN